MRKKWITINMDESTDKKISMSAKRSGRSKRAEALIRLQGSVVEHPDYYQPVGEVTNEKP